MYRGTTPSIYITVDDMPEEWEKVTVLFDQGDLRIVKETPDLEIYDGDISFMLSASETNSLSTGDVQVQVKVEMPSGEVFYSDLMRFSVEQNISEV